MAHPPSEGQRQASHEEAPAGRGKKTGTAPHLSDRRLEATFESRLHSCDYITLVPNVDYLGNGKCENRRCEKT